MQLTFRLAWAAQLWVLLSCNASLSNSGSIPSDGDLNQQIIRKLTKGIKNQASISSLAPFVWDTVYFIHPYLHPAELRELRRELPTWAELSKESFRKDLRNTLMVFAQKGKVIRTGFSGQQQFYYRLGRGRGVQKASTPRSCLLLSAVLWRAPPQLVPIDATGTGPKCGVSLTPQTLTINISSPWIKA